MESVLIIEPRAQTHIIF